MANIFEMPPCSAVYFMWGLCNFSFHGEIFATDLAPFVVVEKSDLEKMYNLPKNISPQ